MKKNSHRIAVLGAGAWGSALASHLEKAGNKVILWDKDEPNLEEIIKRSELVVFAVPSHAMREVSQLSKAYISPELLVVSVAKGLEQKTTKTMSEVLCEELGHPERITVLSGPSFAKEVKEGLPTAVTIAGETEEAARKAASYFHFDNFRVYTSIDVVGVELGGVLKNIIALAVGIVDGVGMGHNARAALITRGLAEMQRLVIKLGGQPLTVTGLSVLGDLLLTSTGDLSRNRQVGLRLGKGEKLEDILKSLGQVAEGVTATAVALELAKKHSISVPIITEVDKVLSGKSSIDDAVKSLLNREPKAETK